MNMTNIEDDIENYFAKVITTLNRLDRIKLAQLANILHTAYEQDKTIFVFGNGGSASTASHFCGDFIKGASCGLDKRFKMMCLSDNLSALMAIANDISYEDIFIEQLINFIKKGDVVIGISGSGNSINVVKAIEYANSREAITIAFCGYDGGKLKNIVQLAIHADINDMEVSEDIHLIIEHCIKQILMKTVWSAPL
jgi:D-sedoheptulose 7-phosphate isomerase